MLWGLKEYTDVCATIWVASVGKLEHLDSQNFGQKHLLDLYILLFRIIIELSSLTSILSRCKLKKPWDLSLNIDHSFMQNLP